MSNDHRDLTDAQAAELIRQQTIELANQARQVGLPMLAYLFEMATAEADDVLRRLQAEEAEEAGSDKKRKPPR